MDRVFHGLAGLLLGIFLGLRPREIPGNSPASPWKTPSLPPVLLGLTQYQNITMGLNIFNLVLSKVNVFLQSEIKTVDN